GGGVPRAAAGGDRRGDRGAAAGGARAVTRVGPSFLGRGKKDREPAARRRCLENVGGPRRARPAGGGGGVGGSGIDRAGGASAAVGESRSLTGGGGDVMIQVDHPAPSGPGGRDGAGGAPDRFTFRTGLRVPSLEVTSDADDGTPSVV